MNRIATIIAAGTMLTAATACQTSMDGEATTSNGMSANVTTVGGAAMYPTRNIVENASQSPIHTTLVKAVVAADLAGTLSGPGPFTVFAPTDSAFAAVPQATISSLLEPANKPTLVNVLTYHVVPGRVTAADLVRRIQSGGGTASVATVQGGSLSFMMQGSNVMIMGANGSRAIVSQADVMQSNGVIHVIDGVLLPA